MSWNNVKSSIQNSIKQNGSGAITGNLLQGVLLTICNEAEIGIGPQGKSAYQVWLDEGNVGTVSDFFASLKGETGDNVSLRKTTAGIKWKLSSQPDTAYQLLVTIDELKLHFSDLTATDIAALQQPATDAADSLTVYVQQKDLELIQLQQDTESAQQGAVAATDNADNAAVAAANAADAANQAAADADSATGNAINATSAANQAATDANAATNTADQATAAATNAADAANAAATSATNAAQSATTASDKAEELNVNQPKIVNGEWWVYDLATHSYINTGLPARGPQGKGPIVLANGNYGNWDDVTQTYSDTGIAAAATIHLENLPVDFTEAATRENILTGETVPTVFGKLKKWFSDLGALAWKTKVNYQTDIDDLPVIPDAQIQSDWNQTDDSRRDFIRNKPTIPTKTSEFTNDSGFITTASVTNEINAHNSDEGAHGNIRSTLSELQKYALTALKVHEGTGIKVTVESNGDITLSAEIDNEIFITVASLPSMGLENKIYLIPKSNPETGNTLDEYIWKNGSWELIGSVSVDLTDYYTKEETVNEIDSAINTHNSDENVHVNLRPKHKQTVLLSTGWVSQSSKWLYKISDSDIKEYNVVEFKPSNESEETWLDAGIYSYGNTTDGFLNIYSREKPGGHITIYYSILN